MTTLRTTPSQTVGPFFRHGLAWEDGPFVVAQGATGGFWVRGTVLDGAGEAVPDALVETWQADPAGNFAHPDSPGAVPAWFRGFGRSPTDADGRWAVFTVRPGPVPAGDGLQAPHLALSVFARGLLQRVVTRLYFPEDVGAAHDGDPVLAAVPAERRATLVAAASDDGYRFDIRLQGSDETVFFAL